MNMNARLRQNTKTIYPASEHDIAIWNAGNIQKCSWNDCFVDFLINNFRKAMRSLAAERKSVKTFPPNLRLWIKLIKF